jgi:hypothetical protein
VQESFCSEEVTPAGKGEKAMTTVYRDSDGVLVMERDGARHEAFISGPDRPRIETALILAHVRLRREPCSKQN